MQNHIFMNIFLKIEPKQRIILLTKNYNQYYTFDVSHIVLYSVHSCTIRFFINV